MSTSVDARSSDEKEGSQRGGSILKSTWSSGDAPVPADYATKSEEQPPPSEESEAAKLSPIHEAAFIFMICMAQFLALAGLAQSIAPLGIIGRSFDVTDEAELSWYPAAFSLTVGTFILPAGRLVSFAPREDNRCTVC